MEMFAGEITVTVTGPDGRPIPAPPPTPSDVQVWAALAEADDFLDDALIYFGTATEWFDIYKTLETLHPQVWPWRRGISVAKLGTKKGNRATEADGELGSTCQTQVCAAR